MFFLNLPDSLVKLSSNEIICEPHLCSRVRFPRSKCEMCLHGCPTGAISWDKTLKIDNDKCNNCGICISRCPNGVFWSRRHGDSFIAQDISRLLSGNDNRSIVFSCSRSDQIDYDVIILPCLGRLTENILLAPFVFGASLVEIQWPECTGCTYEKCLSHLESVFSFSRKLVSTIGQDDSCIKVNKGGKYCKGHPAHNRLSRRDLFHKLRSEATPSVAAFLPEFGNSGSNEAWPHFIGAKRAYLLKLLRAFTGHITASVPAENVPLANIEINNKCVGCPVCTTLCPTGALGRIEKNDGVDIYFRPDICVGCKICQEACLFRAISLLPTVELLHLVTGQSQKLLHLDRKICNECSSEFLSIEQEICPTCRHEKGDIVLSMKGRE